MKRVQRLINEGRQQQKARPDVSCTELLCAIRDCEQSRLTAQMSGFETGWEHPTTQTMWQRVVTLSNYIQHNAQVEFSEGSEV